MLRNQLLEVSLSSKNDEKPVQGCVCCSDHNSIVGYRRWLLFSAHPRKGTERYALRNAWYLSSHPIHAFFSSRFWCLQRLQKWGAASSWAAFIFLSYSMIKRRTLPFMLSFVATTFRKLTSSSKLQKTCFLKNLYLFFSKLASGRNPPNRTIWLVPRAGSFLRLLPANPGGIVGSFIHKFVCCLWMSKTVIFNHFFFKLALLLAL